jgi:hypothetical protein
MLIEIRYEDADTADGNPTLPVPHPEPGTSGVGISSHQYQDHTHSLQDNGRQSKIALAWLLEKQEKQEELTEWHPPDLTRISTPTPK